MVTWNEENAAHLLSRAGFGGKATEIRSVARMGLQKAVDQMLAVKPYTKQGPGRGGSNAQDTEDLHDLRVWWVKRMVKARSNRLQEKMTLFWHDHFATSIDVVQNNLWMAKQNRVLREYGLGSFRELVFQITKDPAMLDFLDLKLSTKTKPNENYPREVMELFVLGVRDLNDVDNYTQTDVLELSRAMTGWQILSDEGAFTFSRWDTTNKSLFAGKSYQVLNQPLGIVDSSGAQLPPGQNVIDILFTHLDTDTMLTMPRFLAKKLWEYFAYPNPSKALIDELTGPFIATASQGYLISSLLRSILTHDEFYSETAKASSVKNPAEYAVHAIRALGAATTVEPLPDLITSMGMALLDPPGVNGWSNGLPWLSTGQLLARFEYAQTLAAGRSRDLKINPKRLFKGSSTTVAEVVDSILGKLGMTSRIPANARQALIDYCGTPTSLKDPVFLEQKVRGVVALALQLPEFHLH